MSHELYELTIGRDAVLFCNCDAWATALGLHRHQGTNVMITSRYRAWLEHGNPEDLTPELEALLPALQAKARFILGNAADADDAVQEACMVLLKTRERLPAEVPLAAIVHRLTGQRALMEARARQRRWSRFATMACLD